MLFGVCKSIISVVVFAQLKYVFFVAVGFVL